MSYGEGAAIWVRKVLPYQEGARLGKGGARVGARLLALAQPPVRDAAPQVRLRVRGGALIKCD